jgi:hypothetical protein
MVGQRGSCHLGKNVLWLWPYPTWFGHEHVLIVFCAFKCGRTLQNFLKWFMLTSYTSTISLKILLHQEDELHHFLRKLVFATMGMGK